MIPKNMVWRRSAHTISHGTSESIHKKFAIGFTPEVWKDVVSFAS